MPAGVMLVINAAWLVAGFALVLWGLRIFKLWVAALGVVVGGALGGGIAALAGSDELVVAAVLAGALAGALLAWPLQKVMAAIGVGIACALLAAAGTVAIAGSDHAGLAAVAGFVVGGILAFSLFDIVIIGAMAFNGAQAIFHAVFVSPDTYASPPGEIARLLLTAYANRFVAFVVTTVLFVGYALWYQRGPSRRKERTPLHQARAITARRVSVRLAALMIAGWVVSAFLLVSGAWNVSPFELVGMHPLAWPVVCLAAFAFVRPRPRLVNTEGDVVAGPRERRRRLPYLAAFAAIVAPVLTVGLLAAYGAPWALLDGYYDAFIGGSAAGIAAKWGFTFALLPVLLASAPPRIVRTPDRPAPAEDGADEREPEPTETQEARSAADEPAAESATEKQDGESTVDEPGPVTAPRQPETRSQDG